MSLILSYHHSLKKKLSKHFYSLVRLRKSEKKERKMFIAILKYIKPLAEVDAVLTVHRAYLKGLFDQNKLLVCGTQNPRVGGVIISMNVSREEFEKILKEDPFSKAGMIEYQIIEFAPTFYNSILKSVLEKG
jgi:uncharacterized protein YciI